MRIAHDSINQRLRFYLRPIAELQTGVANGGAGFVFQGPRGSGVSRAWRMGGLEALWIQRGDVRDSGGSGGSGGLGASRGVVGVASALPNVMTFFSSLFFLLSISRFFLDKAQTTIRMKDFNGQASLPYLTRSLLD